MQHTSESFRTNTQQIVTIRKKDQSQGLSNQGSDSVNKTHNVEEPKVFTAKENDS